MIIQIKSTEQYFLMVHAVYCVLYKVVLIFESVEKILKCDHSNKIYRAVFSYGAVYRVLYKVILIFESVEEILKCDHSNGSYKAILS